MLQNLGISTSYFAARNFSIYDSVARAYKLGFRLIELGANHDFEENILGTCQKIRRDFPDVIFTQHCYFPPVFKKEFLSNTAEGLTAKNQMVLTHIFQSAEILETEIVSFHTGFNAQFRYSGLNQHWQGFKEFTPRKKIAQDVALKGLADFIREALVRAQKTGIKVAIENIIGGGKNPTTLTTVDDFTKFFRSFPDLEFLFDYGHGFIVLPDFERFFTFGEKIIEMHLDDVTPKMHDHRVLGKGILDLENMFAKIKKLPRMPILILEHSAEVKEEEIKGEVKLVEKYLESC